jgi:hypothetical protein
VLGITDRGAQIPQQRTRRPRLGSLAGPVNQVSALEMLRVPNRELI